MFFFFEFLFYLIFFILKLYSILDKTYIFSRQGSKLEKYVSSKSMTNVTSNFGNRTNNVFNLSNFIELIKSPNRSKQFFTFLLASTTLVFIKFAFDYNFMTSNFYIVSIFNKKIDLVSTFSKYFIIFKALYYILFSFFVYSITYKLFNRFINKDKKVRSKEQKNSIQLGIDCSNEEKVAIEDTGLFQNILVTGSIGSGKTTGAISNIVDGLIEKQISGLILDVKGEYINTVKKIAKKYDRLSDIVEISLNGSFIYNPLDKPNISSTELAHNLKKILTLLSENNLSDSFWIDKTEAYIKNFIDMIRIYSDYVSFMEIHKLVSDDSYLNSKISIVKDMLLKNNYSDKIIFEVTMALNNILNEYLKLDTRTAGIIKAEITRITNMFATDYMINQRFDKKSDDINFLNNKIYVLSINIAQYTKLAKVISTYLKLDFQKQILSQNKEYKPTFFICDEYQEFANVEDAHFFSLSREYKCINVVSVQSYTSIINALRQESSAKVIIQNLVNKIWFRNDDTYTVQEIIKQIGKTDKDKTTISIAEGGQNSRYNPIFKKFSNSKSNLSQTYSVLKNTEYVYNEEYFTQKLKTFEATALLTDGNNIKLIDKLKFKRWEE